MRKITLSEYNSIPKDYRGIWTVERWDLPNWAEIREKHMGKRTMMVYDKGTCLLVEGLGFEIVAISLLNTDISIGISSDLKSWMIVSGKRRMKSRRK